MALVRCDFFSDVLELSTSMTVVLPQSTSSQIGMTGAAGAGDAPTLYLLHGLSDDDTIWLRRTSIERYAAPLGLAVVMPQVARSFYTDEAHGNRYWTFLSEELPEIARSFFRLSDRREDTFVAGLSMGGYGAVKWALRQPDRFAAAATLSGAVDVVALAGLDHEPGRDRLWHTVFGGRTTEGTDDDLFHLLERVDPARAPELYVGCGTEDRLLAHNERFLDAARARGLDVTADLRPGEHEWGVWDAMVQDVLAWLPLRGQARTVG
ncbi:alpha/beta hydrolase [Geodermatophilus sp. SYSU D00691]